MTTLEELNRVRAHAGRPPLKSWKRSKAALLEAIGAMTPAVRTDARYRAEADVRRLLTCVSEDAQTVPTDAQDEAEADVRGFPICASEDAPIAPVDAKETPRGAIGVMVMDLLQTDATYPEVVEAVRRAYPTARTTARSVASTAMDLRAAGLDIPSRRRVRPTSGRS